MKDKIKTQMSEKEKQTVPLKGEVAPEDAFLIARRFAQLEKSKLKTVALIK